MIESATITGDNIHFLAQAETLLELISDRLYADPPQIALSPVGAHLRHCLDLYSSFLAGLSVGRIDYDQRARDPRLETDREYALGILRNLIEQLGQCTGEQRDSPLRVAMDRGAAEQGEDAFTVSSVRRELQFLRSHTVHHYALIAAVLRLHGYEPPADFGVAPATLSYRRQLAKT